MASSLPSSTPHWSKLLMFQITPWVKTLCSYSASSRPRFLAFTPSRDSMLEGRLPGILPIGRQRRVVGAERQRVGLRAAVGRQVLLEGAVDEVRRHDVRALVQQLVEGMLAHRAFGAPQHRRGGVVDRRGPRGRRACRSIPSRAAAGTRAAGAARSSRAAPRAWARRGSWCSRRRSAPSAPARSSRAASRAKCSSTSRAPVQELLESRRSRSRKRPRSPPPTRPRSARRPSPTSAGPRVAPNAFARLGVRGDRDEGLARPSWRARSALAIVSCVVKVFETTTNSVLAGSAPSSARSRSRGIDVGGEAHVERAVASARRRAGAGRGPSRRCRG